MDIAVYLFTGFLEAGKTSFLKETCGDPRFATGEKTLLLICEEGEVELDLNALKEKNIFLEIIEDKNQLNEENLATLCKRHGAKRVVVEFNGMWELPDLYESMPQNWILFQEMTFFDGTKAQNYNTNMRALVVDKLRNCELCVFNRCKDDTDKEALHKIVRGINRRCDILYEYENGEIEPDMMEDPLPFDIDAKIIEVGIKDYAIWYRDMLEDMEKYHDKTVKFTGVVAIDKKIPDDCFIIGRPVMECCADDIAFKGVLAKGRSSLLANGDWIVLTAQIRIEKHKLYKGVGPVLYLKDYAVTSVPQDPVATFY